MIPMPLTLCLALLAAGKGVVQGQHRVVPGDVTKTLHVANVSGLTHFLALSGSPSGLGGA